MFSNKHNLLFCLNLFFANQRHKREAHSHKKPMRFLRRLLFRINSSGGKIPITINSFKTPTVLNKENNKHIAVVYKYINLINLYPKISRGFNYLTYSFRQETIYFLHFTSQHLIKTHLVIISIKYVQNCLKTPTLLDKRGDEDE